MKKLIRDLSHVQIIALGFALLISFGTLLLMTSFATESGKGASFLDAFFTATSASCVTGLVTVDTGTVWSAFGQGVILFLIQLGGLGFMTIATLFFLLLRKRMGLRQKEVMSESVNSSRIGGVLKLAKHIVLGTLLFEGIGAAVLFARFYFAYNMSFGKALWFGIFHAVSAFCNAGFDLNGHFSSFTNYSSDAVVCITLMVLIVIGGLGFFVWEDVIKKKFRFRLFSLHSKIVFAMTAGLIVIPSILFFLTEGNASHSGFGAKDAIIASLFDAVTPRTAGMNITDTAALSPSGKLLTVILMFIGGSPSSTAGGIKTTTIAVLFLFTLTSVRKTRYAGAFGRRLREDTLKKALSVFFFNLVFAVAGMFLILISQPDLVFGDVVFEVFSAIGTVGMSAGITRELNTLSRVVIILLMFIGRVGSISFGSALIEKKAPPPVMAPYEDITVG